MPHMAINRGKGHTDPSVSTGPISFLSSRCARITKGDNGILQWIAFASNAFNVLVPFYTDVTTTPGVSFQHNGRGFHR